MIILFHSLCLVGRFVYNIIFDKILANRFINDVYVPLEPRDYGLKTYVFSKRCVRELKDRGIPKRGDVICKFDEEAGLKFFPPVYCQRYNAIKEEMSKEIWQGKLKKVLDVGCAELSFFPFLKNLPGVEEVLAMDIDVDLLEAVAHRVGPLLADHLASRLTPLHVMVLAGSIAKPNPCLLGCDAVIAIELIEHLFPDELEEVPFTIFGYIRPSLALITTPNSDFNVLFGHMRGFRHPDHKFEWSRLQFQDWALNIVERYPDYEVTFRGIGRGPIGSEHLGDCSQMAIFTKNDVHDLASGHEGTMTSKNDRTLTLVDPLKIQENYRVIAEYQYPVYVETRTERQIIKDNASCFISNFGTRITHDRKRLYMEYEENGCYSDEDCDEDILVPFEDIMNFLGQKHPTEEELRELLEECRWDVEINKGRLVVNYTSYENQNRYSSDDEEEVDEAKREWNTSEKAEVAECDWDSNDKNDWCQTTQNLSPVPSCTSDWNEDDTQARAYVDSGYPNSFSAQDKDFANSVDLHGSSLEEDSGDDMEEDLENGVVQDRLQGMQLIQNENMDNMHQMNVAANHELFYEVQGNQDENQDVVNNNCDNEGNNAEAEVFGLNDGPEEGVIVEEGSESEADDQEPPSEEESDLEGEQIGIEEEEELVERLLGRIHHNSRQSIPRRDEVSVDPPANHQLPDLNYRTEPEAAGDARRRVPVLPVADPDHDEGFAEALAGPAIAVAPVDEGGAGEPSPF